MPAQKIKLMRMFIRLRNAEDYADDLRNRLAVNIKKNFYGRFEVEIVLRDRKKQEAE